MKEADFYLLQKENEKLNRIISALLEQIETKRKDNRLLLDILDEIKDDHSRAGQVLDINEIIERLKGKGMWTNEQLFSNSFPGKIEKESLYGQTREGMMANYSTLWQTREGIPENESILWQTQKGMPESQSVLWQTREGMPANDSTLRQTQTGMPESQSVLLPTRAGMPENRNNLPDTGASGQGKQAILQPTRAIALSEDNISRLYGQLQLSVMRTSRDTARKGASKLLIHFHNKGKGDYPQLEALTGYSSSGLAKLLKLLRQKKLIHRHKAQKFSLTETAVRLMTDAKLAEAVEDKKENEGTAGSEKQGN